VEDASSRYDLVIVGGTAGGLSVAISSLRSGLEQVRIVESGSAIAFPELVGQERLDVGYGETVSSIDVGDSGDSGDQPLLRVVTDGRNYQAKAVMIARRMDPTDWKPSIPTPDSDRVLVDRCPEGVDDQDILVVGSTDHAVELTAMLAAGGARVVLAAGGMDPQKLSPAADNVLRRLERERSATVLYRSTPDEIGLVDGFPMAYFVDRRMPDLQVDGVVFASGRSMTNPSEVGLSDAAAATGLVWFLGDASEVPDHVPTGPGWTIGRDIAAVAFPDLQLAPEPSSIEVRRRHEGAIGELRAEHYNATITKFEPSHSDLWVLRVAPDQGQTSHLPGQYASLGLGYWEERIDDAVDPDLDKRWDKLIRRSYSISSRMFDEHGYLADDTGGAELEFYIVLVPPSPENVPGLTPRLALKQPGDRIYLGPKVAGRYTLAPVIDPTATVLFLSTGTGEAPHNAMVVELLRKGHTGPIISAVSVRQWADLGYRDKHADLESRFANYHYLPAPTREPDVPKRYIQDMVKDDVFTERFGVAVDAGRTHVFLCGNPAMIGLPEEVDGEVRFPDVTGVVELLTERGFTLDRRNLPGNIHYEEYW